MPRQVRNRQNRKTRRWAHPGNIARGSENVTVTSLQTKTPLWRKAERPILRPGEPIKGPALPGQNQAEKFHSGGISCSGTSTATGKGRIRPRQIGRPRVEKAGRDFALLPRVAVAAGDLPEGARCRPGKTTGPAPAKSRPARPLCGHPARSSGTLWRSDLCLLDGPIRSAERGGFRDRHGQRVADWVGAVAQARPLPSRRPRAGASSGNSSLGRAVRYLMSVSKRQRRRKPAPLLGFKADGFQ